MYTASGQFMQSSGDLTNGSPEPVYRSDDQVVTLPEPAHALCPARSIATGASGSGVGEHPIGNNAGGRDDIVLLIDGLLPGRDPDVNGNTHLQVQQMLSDNPSRLKRSIWKLAHRVHSSHLGEPRQHVCALVHDRSMRRFDETWHLLLEWTLGQTPSERMSALILDEEGFESIDPSHPLGGKDGGADALTLKAGDPWVMAVYFPRGQQSLKDITAKLVSDVEKAKSKDPRPAGVAFVTNQELRLAEREELVRAGGDTAVELYHLERITSILDRPHMAGVREQFLGIPAGPPPILVTAEVIGVARKFERSSELLDLLVESEGDSLPRTQQLRAE